MSGPHARILAVDDEPRYTWVIKSILDGLGYETITASDGRSALQALSREMPDLILLDVKLPDMSGRQVCRRIREFSTIPVIMLTALAQEADKVAGLEAGADDYVTKPFGAQELVARVRAALRRAAFSQPEPAAVRFQSAALEIDYAQQQVTLDGEKVRLTATEYQLLCELSRYPGRALSAEHLLGAIWGPGYEQDDHVLRQAIYRLRKKIEPDPGAPRYIHNQPGVGYLLATP